MHGLASCAERPLVRQVRTEKSCKPRHGILRNVESLRINQRCTGLRRVSTSALMSREDWAALTDRLVVGSAIPLSVLVLPQLIQNAINMSSGNVASLSIISWEGYLSGLLGNTLMCTHFAGRGEKSAVTIQILGIVNGMLVLLQVALASFMPAAVFILTAVMTSTAVAVSLARLKQKQAAPHEDSSAASEDGSLSLWSKWQLLVGMCGLAVLPQVICSLLLNGEGVGLLPGLSTLLLVGVYFAAQMRSAESRRSLGKLAGSLPGWAATLLFAVSPLPQLVRNFLEPTSLEGLSIGTMLLALTGNALMVPRALFTRDVVWMAGVSWACTAGWGTLLSMFLGTSAATGQSYFAAAPFAAVTVALLAYLATAVITDSQAALELKTS